MHYKARNTAITNECEVCNRCVLFRVMHTIFHSDCFENLIFGTCRAGQFLFRCYFIVMSSQFFFFLDFLFTVFISLNLVILEQFYSFICVIDLHRFYHNVYSSHVLFFKFLPLVILLKRFLHSFYFHVNLVI